jgi:GPH family glycoside/pentoside/hexuronide:cation symporter
MSAADRQRPRVGRPTQALYGLGAVSSGIKMKALSAFLLIFYNQAIGLSPTTVSLAITLVMIGDAISDPIVGYVSDHLKTPWGRRHPLMYLAAAPLALGFFLLWNPPAGWSETALFWYLLVCLLVIRICDTFFELPSLALAPELVEDYDGRTGIVSSRIFFRTLATFGVTILGFQVFLKRHADGSGGPTDRAGYLGFSIAMALTMFVVILVSASSTHRFIPWLRRPVVRSAQQPHSVRQFFKDARGLLRNPSAAAMLGVGAFTAVASGAKSGLEFYFGLYFWKLSPGQISVLALLTAIGALAGALLVPRVSRRLGKRRGTITCYTLGLLSGAAPVTLRLFDLMPANGTNALFAILMAEAVLQGLLYVMTAVMMNAMLSDVIEDVAVQSGQRSEGLLFSADAFFSKAVSGLGVFISSTLLTLIAFPRDVKVTPPSPEMIWRLGALYVPTLLVVTGAAIGLLMLFRIDRAKHAENLAKLHAAELTDVAVGAPTTTL